jgi:hypothetical protein
MKKAKAILDFIKFSIPEKIAFYYNVIAKLTGNALFTKPDVTLEEAKAAVDGLEAAYLAKKDGGHTATSAMYDAEDNADYYFRIIVAYVNRIAWGNETAILSSGFNLAKQPSSIQKPILSVIDGDNSGSVYLVARAIDKAGSYIWQMAKDKLPDTEEGWTTIGHTTQAYFQITNLTVTARYYFRVAAVTPDGTLDFTAAVMKVVV